MSKQSKAKGEQCYVGKPTWPSCGNCEYFTSTTEVLDGVFRAWTKESNLRCAKGGFKVLKGGLCGSHKRKEGGVE